MKWYVYILELTHGRRYYWSTNDLDRRMEEHKSWKTFTTKNKFVRILGYKEFETLELAREYEKEVKKMKNKKYIAKLFGIAM